MPSATIRRGVPNLRFDIEPLLTTRTESSHSGFWNDVEEDKGGVHEDEGMAMRGKENSMPRALERVFCWLEEVEAGHQNVRGVVYSTKSMLLPRVDTSISHVSICRST